MRILWLVKGLGPGGAERLLVAAAGAHRRDEFEIEVVYLLPWKDHLVAELEQLGVRTTCLGVRNERDLRWAGRLRRHLRHTARRRRSTRTRRTPPRSVASWRGRCRRRSDPRWSRPSTIPGRPTSCRRVSRTRPRSGSTTRCSPSPTKPGHRCAGRNATGPKSSCTASTSTPSPRSGRERDAVRAELGAEPGTVLVGTVANYHPKKDWPNVLRAARRLADRDPACGSARSARGRSKPRSRRSATSCGLGGIVTLTGYRPDATRLMAGCDVFVLGSKWEGLPVALMEASALGLPIVATRVGGIPSAFRDGEDALLVAPGAPDELADAIEKLIRDDDLRDAPRRGRAPPVARLRRHPGSGAGRGRSYREVVRAMSDDLEFRAATDADLPAIIELLHASMGRADDTRFDALFRWKHVENAFGPSPMWVACAGDRIVGLRTFMRWEFERGGRTLSAACARSTPRRIPTSRATASSAGSRSTRCRR